MYLEKSGYILSSNYFSELSLAQKYNSQYQGLFQYSLSDDLMNPNNWRRFISLNDGESYLYICPVNNSLISISGDVNSILMFMIDRSSLESFFS